MENTAAGAAAKRNETKQNKLSIQKGPNCAYKMKLHLKFVASITATC